MISSIIGNTITTSSYSNQAQISVEDLARWILGLILNLALFPFLLLFDAAAVSPEGNSCNYRASLDQCLPYDYYLWQNGGLCSGREGQEACSPAAPEIPDTRAKIEAFENGAVRAEYNRLPTEAMELERFLLGADITWVEDGDSTIEDTIQREIDSAAAEDVHMVFGFAHAVVGQTEFFNGLLQRVHGVTHLALESDRYGRSGRDIQRSLDCYLVTGDLNYRPTFSSPMWPGTDVPIEEEKEIRDRYALLDLGYSKCLNVVYADIPSEATGSLDEYYRFAAREIYAVESVQMRQDPARRDVVFWRWGAVHAEKHRLPFYLGIRDPQAKIVSIVVNGGTYLAALAFDRALEDLGWLERTFILKLDGYREADYIIHIPTEGRRREWGISREGDPVVQNIFDPPKQ